MKKSPKSVTRKQRRSNIWSCLLPAFRSVFNFPSSLAEFEAGNALRDEARCTLAERVINVSVWAQTESAVVFFAARSGPQGFVGIELHIGSVCWFEMSYHHQSREDNSPADARRRFDLVPITEPIIRMAKHQAHLLMWW